MDDDLVGTLIWLDESKILELSHLYVFVSI